MRFDPNGLTDYTVNKKSGNVSVVKGTEDDGPDRIVKSYQRGKKKGQVKKYKRKKKKGESKTVSNLDNIEKGILSDGKNFKTEDNLIAVGGKGQPTVKGVKSFALGLSEYVGKEISGLSYSSLGSSNEITDIVLGQYQYNSRDESNNTHPFELMSKYGKMYSVNNIFQAFHTHPDGKLGLTYDDPEKSTDYKNLQNEKPKMPNAKFSILYRVEGKLKVYPYTHLYKPK